LKEAAEDCGGRDVIGEALGMKTIIGDCAGWKIDSVLP
jgi:hypothetical protein